MEVESDDGKKSILPLFRWTVSVHDVEAKEKKPRKSTWIEKVEYHLHPTFAVPIRGKLPSFSDLSCSKLSI